MFIVKLIFKHIDLQCHLAHFFSVFHLKNVQEVFLKCKKAPYRITELPMAKEGQDSREMARWRRHCPTLLSIIDGTKVEIYVSSTNILAPEPYRLAELYLHNYASFIFNGTA